MKEILLLVSLVITIINAAPYTVPQGGTNSDVGLNGNKMMWSNGTGGSIVEHPFIVADLTGLAIVKVMTGVTPATTALFTLIGYPTDAANGPHINTYTYSDNYPLKQSLSYAHNNIADCYDCYWDGISWKSSYSGSNFRVYKQSNKYTIDYNAGITAGSAASFTTALSISTAGLVTATNAELTGYLKLPTLGVTSSSNLNTYITKSYNFPVSGAFSGTISATVLRIGNSVTYTFGTVTGTVSSAGVLNVDISSLDSAFDFAGGATEKYHSTLISVTNGGETAGRIRWHNWYTLLGSDYYYFKEMTIYASSSGGSFSTGSARGIINSFTVTYLV